MAELPSCLTCTLLAARDAGTRPLWDAIYRTPHWDVVHSYNAARPGWLVLVLRRHLEAVADLTPDEARELGALIRATSQALAEATGCVKTYVIQFAEAAEHPHVHVHIVPRMAAERADRRGPLIFGDLGVPEAERVPAAAMDQIAALVQANLRITHPVLPS